MSSRQQARSWSANDSNVPALMGALRQRGSPALRRIASCTIVALVDDLADAATVQSMAQELSRRHPARVIVVVRLPDEVSGIDAEVASMAGEHRGISTVFFESVVLRVRGDAVRGLPALVRASAHRGLPVIAWTYDRLPPSDEPVLDLADRVLVDSTREPTAAEVSDLVALARRIATTDLAWVALAPWRDAAGAALASLGDSPSGGTIQHVEIRGEPGSCAILAAWFAGRFTLDPNLVQHIEAEHLAVRISTHHDGRDESFVLGDGPIPRDETEHHHTIPVGSLTRLETLDRALGSGVDDLEWEASLTWALEHPKDGKP